MLNQPIQGLTYIRNFMTPEQEGALLAKIDEQPWRHDLKRRVQHYGYQYDYKARRVSPDLYLGELPDWLQSIGGQFEADQAIINEYLPGQGISAHVDCVPCFADKIVSLSLGSGAIMQFARGHEKQELYLEPRSIVILSDIARYEWTHAIPARKSDKVGGIKVPRDRRVSITFRRVMTQAQ